ncbi:MAG: hypothetical protein MUP81_01030, partial [Dehalococcoidia bacterium]|nr:hypothetical protein [Dehalococcoidia bacterium]
MNGILFKPWKIKAIAESDREWQTRRVIKQAIHEFKSLEGIHIEIAGAVLPARDKGFVAWWPGNSKGLAEFTKQQYQTGFLPRYQVGEVVYVKEAWCESYYGKPICYKLDGNESPGPKGFWRSPMFLKAINARYFIKITGVRAERVQDITEEDAKAEGIDPRFCTRRIEIEPGISSFISGAKARFSI